jgi:hypothetical protein
MEPRHAVGTLHLYLDQATGRAARRRRTRGHHDQKRPAAAARTSNHAQWARRPSWPPHRGTERRYDTSSDGAGAWSDRYARPAPEIQPPPSLSKRFIPKS